MLNISLNLAKLTEYSRRRKKISANHNTTSLDLFVSKPHAVLKKGMSDGSSLWEISFFLLFLGITLDLLPRELNVLRN